MAIKRVFPLLVTSFEISILHHWCTNLCYQNSGVWLYTGLWRFCWILPRNLRRVWKKWKRVSKLQISFLSLRLSSNLSLFLSTPARPCFLGPRWSKRKSTQASGTLLSLVQSQSSGCTAVSLGLGLSFFIFLGIFNTAFARSKKSLNPILNSADTFVANMRDRSLVTNVFGHCLWHLLVWCIWLPNN